MDTTGTFWMPPGNSTIAGDVDSLFYFILYASIIIFVLVVGLSAYFSMKYRRRDGEVGKTDGLDHNVKLEIIWTIIPTILVMIVFVWGFKTYMYMNVVPKDAYEIKVNGQKWFWSFDYPEGGNSVNELIVPVDRPVKLLMASKDVIHSFFVPNFRIKMDVLPNRYSITWFEAHTIGEYNLFCTEFCGKGHSEMIGKVKVVSQEEFEQYAEDLAFSGEGMTLEEFGAKLYIQKACVTCHKIDGSNSTGPPWDNLYGKEEHLADGSSVKVDENYIRESILNPMAKITQGYQPVMPTYQGILKDKQIDALIAYIKSLQEDESLINE
ncbi:MAG: cytochrome c oxidase subunit II [Calditrichaeota bacterium]|nr:MAG: cytochrome c oxidase subunit II [Calditrichota bacterium]